MDFIRNYYGWLKTLHKRNPCVEVAVDLHFLRWGFGLYVNFMVHDLSNKVEAIDILATFGPLDASLWYEF